MQYPRIDATFRPKNKTEPIRLLTFGTPFHGQIEDRSDKGWFFLECYGIVRILFQNTIENILGRSLPTRNICKTIGMQFVSQIRVIFEKISVISNGSLIYFSKTFMLMILVFFA